MPEPGAGCIGVAVPDAGESGVVGADVPTPDSVSIVESGGSCDVSEVLKKLVVDGVFDIFPEGGKEAEDENEVFPYGSSLVEYREVGRGNADML